MKLFYIANARIPGDKAHSAQVMAMCDAFASRGADVTLIVPKRTQNVVVQDPFVYHEVPPRFRIIWLPSLDLTHRGAVGFVIQSCTFVWSAIAYCRAHEADVLYTRDIFSLFVFSFFKKFRSKLFWETHKRATNFLIARGAKFAAGIIAINDSIKKFFVTMGVAAKRILVAHDGVNLTLFDKEISMADARIHLSLPQDRFIICYTGRFQTMGEGKGIEDVFEAIRLLDNFRERVLFVCVGAQGDELNTYMEKARAAGIENNVRIVPRVPISELVWYQKAADALAMPFPATDYYAHDISPLKLFEYLTSKRLIIASDLPSIREVIDEKSSVLYAAGSVSALRDAVVWVMTHEREAYDRSVRAYELCHLYTWSARADNILNHIKACLAYE